MVETTLKTPDFGNYIDSESDQGENLPLLEENASSEDQACLEEVVEFKYQDDIQECLVFLGFSEYVRQIDSRFSKLIEVQTQQTEEIETPLALHNSSDMTSGEFSILPEKSSGSLDISQDLTIQLKATCLEEIKLFVSFVRFCKTQDESLITLKRFSDKFKLERLVNENLEKGEFQTELELVEAEVNKRFPILILVDLGGTLLYRCEKKGAGLSFSFKTKSHAYFMRPGHDQFILNLSQHPRVKFGLYSSIMRKNVLPILYRIYDKSNNQGGLGEELEELAKVERTAPLVFDQQHCATMYDHKYYRELADNKWDTFRALERVFSSEHCKDTSGKQIYAYHNTILIDSEARKVQFDLDNALVNRPYTLEPQQKDVDFLASPDEHRQELQDLATYIQTLLREADNVQDFLSVSPPAAHFVPKKMIKGNLDSESESDNSAEETELPGLKESSPQKDRQSLHQMNNVSFEQN